jgi:putative ABC transport system permease protein
MIKQMCKLVWHRKRTNFLIINEIFFSFLVLFVVVTWGLYYLDNYRHPLGFSYDGVWNITVGEFSPGRVLADEQKQQMNRQFRQLLQTLKDTPEVEAAGGIQWPPFTIFEDGHSVKMNGRLADSYANAASDSLKTALNIEMVQGRWFQPSDEALAYRPVVINQVLSDAVSPNESPIGKILNEGDEKEKPQRVIGVMKDFRQYGEYHKLSNYFFFRVGENDTGQSPVGTTNILVKLRPGTPATFEEQLMSKLRSVGKDSSFTIEPLERLRRSHAKVVLMPLAAAGLVGAFLTLMVGLGILGVLWQNVVRRAREIGLRRAVGSPAEGIYRQVLGELAIITSVGVFLGVLLVVQLPLLDLVTFITPRVYALSLSTSVLLIYVLTLSAGLYPSWLATRIQPAEALHAE